MVAIGEVAPVMGLQIDMGLLNGKVMFEARNADLGDIKGQRVWLFAGRSNVLLAGVGYSPERYAGQSIGQGCAADESGILHADQGGMDGGTVFDAHDLRQDWNS